MFSISQIIKAITLAALVIICWVKLWNISLEHIAEEDLKTETRQYAPEMNEVRNALPLQTPSVSDREPTETADITELIETGTDAPLYVSVPIPGPVINQFIQELQDDINIDITAWLQIPGTSIDYPVVKAADNDFYLRRDIYKNEVRGGSLFTDYRCTPDFNGFSTVIYGHNMKNRSMFGDLRFYTDPGFFEENLHGTLYTSTKTYNLTVFACMVVSSDDPVIYSNPQSAEELYEYIKENARIFCEPDYTSKILVLSTCSYEYDNARIAVIASMDG